MNFFEQGKNPEADVVAGEENKGGGGKQKFSSYIIGRYYNADFTKNFNISVWKDKAVMEFYDNTDDKSGKVITMLDQSEMFLLGKVINNIILHRTTQFLNKTPYSEIPSMKIKNIISTKNGDHENGHLLIGSKNMGDDGVRVTITMVKGDKIVEVPLLTKHVEKTFDSDIGEHAKIDYKDISLFNLGQNIDNFNKVILPLYSATNHIIKNIWDSKKNNNFNKDNKDKIAFGSNDSDNNEDIPY